MFDFVPYSHRNYVIFTYFAQSKPDMPNELRAHNTINQAR